jgi:hypothetical protein
LDFNGALMSFLGAFFNNRFMWCFIFLCSSFELIGFQERLTRTKTVEVTGVGLNKEAAIQDGLNSAIRMVAGIYVRSEEVLKNNDFKANIYTYSAGVIKEFRNVKIISGKGLSGLVFVSMDVDVYLDDLYQRLKANKIFDGNLDGKNIVTQFRNRKELFEKANKTFNYLLDSFPEKYLSAEVVERRDISKLSDKNITLLVTYQIKFEKEKFDNLLFYVYSFLESLSDKSGVLSMSKTKALSDYQLWEKILGKNYFKYDVSSLPNQSVRGVSVIDYKDSENPTLKGLDDDSTVILVFDPKLETNDWLRWKWYQIPKMDIKFKKILCDVKFLDELDEVVSQIQIPFEEMVNGLTLFSINKKEKQSNEYSGIILSPFFFDSYRFSEGFRFQIKHQFNPDDLEKIKKTTVGIYLKNDKE